MIKYSLICKKCDLIFDSWFASSKEYEKLVKKKLLNCHSCGSLKVEKSVMAPKFINKKSNDRTEKEFQKFKNLKKDYRISKIFRNNFQYVGQNFAYEARSIHYNR